jgi:lipocalin
LILTTTTTLSSEKIQHPNRNSVIKSKLGTLPILVLKETRAIMMFRQKHISVALTLLVGTTSHPWFGGISVANAQGDDTPAAACPTVETVQDFNLQDFVSTPWYVHQQAQNWYSPSSRNNCVRAEYAIREEPTSQWGYTLDVQNAGRYEDGDEIVDAFLCGYSSQEEGDDSKLKVAPCFLPKEAAGSYWVVAYDEVEGYALISAGQPTIPNGDEGCRTGSSGGIDFEGIDSILEGVELPDEGIFGGAPEGFDGLLANGAGLDIDSLIDGLDIDIDGLLNGAAVDVTLLDGSETLPEGLEDFLDGIELDDSGLWIFSRNPVRDDELVDKVRKIAQDAGFDISVLNYVNQVGCGYDDEEEEAAADMSCQDSATPFSVGFDVFGEGFDAFGEVQQEEQDCDWVANYAWYRCWLYSENCPETCGKCD